MIKREKKVFFHLVTKFTTPWSREKNFFFSFQHYIHYAMVTRKVNWYLLHDYLDYATVIKKYPFFHFTATFTTQIYSYISLRCKPVAKVSKRYPPQKNISNLKTFFLRNFSGVLHDLLPKKVGYLLTRIPLA